MTMRALPTQPEAWRPTAGYYLAAVNEVSAARAVSVSNEAIDEYWKGFWEQCDALMLLEKPTPPPMLRLAWYQQKPVQELPPVPPLPMQGPKGEVQLIEQPQPPKTGSWMGQKIDFPNDFAHDLEDWIKLEPVSLRRDQVLREMAGLEMLATAEQGLGGAPQALPQQPPTSGVTPELPPLPWQAQQPPQGPPA